MAAQLDEVRPVGHVFDAHREEGAAGCASLPLLPVPLGRDPHESWGYYRLSPLRGGQGDGEGAAAWPAFVWFSESPVTLGLLEVGRILRERLSAGHCGAAKTI